jgi:glycyl-tRNA synthetase beta chain
MESNQKYFPLLDKHGRLMNKFITIANINSPYPAKVIAGNEKVVRPRLADARFFFVTDKKKSLQQHAELLENVIFEAQLGTVDQKAQRISVLAGRIAGAIGSNVAWAERAGRLCKADLATGMVGEFPELQGIMGEYYARHDGEPADVARALNEQYQPRFAGDVLPGSSTGAAVALADKLDTLVGILGIGKHPTGDKDPFALRRAAIGVLRILIEKSLALDLHPLVADAVAAHGSTLTNANVARDAVEFLTGRYLALFQEQGISTRQPAAGCQPQGARCRRIQGLARCGSAGCCQQARPQHPWQTDRRIAAAFRRSKPVQWHRGVRALGTHHRRTRDIRCTRQRLRRTSAGSLNIARSHRHLLRQGNGQC